MRDFFSQITLDNIRSSLLTRHEKLAVAESVTAGFLQAALSTAQDASLFFVGGITAYNIDQKVRHLSVNEPHAASCNCVSQRTADEMASGVSKLFKTDWGIGITGYASPIQSSGFQLYAYFSFCNQGEIIRSARTNIANMDSMEAQLLYVDQILESFERVLAK